MAEQGRFRWRARPSEDGPAPVRVWCEKPGYPHPDADGVTQYDNHHFDTEDAAWARLRDDVRAHVRWAGTRVEEAKRALAEAQANAGDAAELFARVEDGFAGVQRRGTGG